MKKFCQAFRGATNPRVKKMKKKESADNAQKKENCTASYNVLYNFNNNNKKRNDYKANKIEKDMINILDFRKLEAGKLIYNHKQVSNLSNILHLKEQLYIETAAKKQITLNYQITENL